MPLKSRYRHCPCGVLVAVSAVVLPVAAHAQDAALDPIEAVEHHILGPQSKFQRLKNEPRDEVQQAREEARRLARAVED